MREVYVERMKQEVSNYLSEAQEALTREDYDAVSTAMMQSRSALENIFFYKSAGRAPVDVLEVARWKHDRVCALMGINRVGNS